MIMSCQSCLQLQMPPRFLLPRLPLAPIFKRSIKSISKPTQNPYNRGGGLPRLETSIDAALERRRASTPLRTGALAIKRGMSAFYDPDTGHRHACTIVQMDRVQVVSHKRRPTSAYWAVQMGAGHKLASNVTRPMLGHFSENGVSPKRHLVEFKVSGRRGLLKIGTVISAGWFKEGQYIDAKANCKGKGFAGGMKRHGFHGQDRSHGVSLTHRSMGSAGGSQGSGSRVLPGKKMAGRMGGQQVTVQNVKVIKVDDDKGMLVLHGRNEQSKGVRRPANEAQAVYQGQTGVWSRFPTPSRSHGRMCLVE